MGRLKTVFWMDCAVGGAMLLAPWLYFGVAHGMFPLNMDYMLRFAKAKQEAGVFERVTREVCVSTDILCDMGDIYKANGYVGKADSCYRLACAMVPCRIVPLYKLFVLYRDVDPERGRVYARKIVGFQYPVVGSVVLRARAEARRFLDSDW